MIIAVDTGGTKTLVMAFSNDGQPLKSERFPTPKDQSEYIQKTSETIADLADQSSIDAICVALPGIVQENIAIICKNLDWHNFAVIDALSKNFPEVPMWLENDANLGGLGAVRQLASPPERCMYVTISTGIGSGFTTNGNIDPTLSSSEVGDIRFEYNGELVSWEGIASGNSIMRDYGVYASQLNNPDEIAEVARRISRGFLALIPALQPDLITVGGGVGAYYDLFSPTVDQELSVLPEQYRCKIITAPHPQEIVAYGCFHYAKDKLVA